ncbi:hypothetical protein DWB84_18695 [Saccharophagus sp. K07]|uniref:Wzz/FepE/Etk N-terminal domain-containing protein n=1 Tax=Saccharophagus sp. K07 TaxID=2283636 RepID=UPI0016524615|nr:Wzz/FepE/Etk N-terminal domain-containing protein [Saccharophagus sp. K07]MBC6907469.1 hypothetical protein [Saccharophagus sp. K07]
MKEINTCSGVKGWQEAEEIKAKHSRVREGGLIDLSLLIGRLWINKWKGGGLVIVFSLAAMAYTYTLPNTYKVEGIYAPAQNYSGSNMSQLSGIAALAGLNIANSDSNEIDRGIALVNSFPFLEKIITENGLKPYLIAVKEWDKKTGELVWDRDIFDPITNKWALESQEAAGEPSNYEAYKRFKKIFNVSRDVKTGMITVGVEFYSPDLAVQWVDLIVGNLNKHFQERDIERAKRNILYLEKKIQETSLSGMHAIFYSMIEGQTKTLMLAEVDEEYLLEMIVEPRASLVAVSPNRALIIAGAASIALLLFMGFVFVQSVRD